MVKKLGVLFMTVVLLGSMVAGCGKNASPSNSNDGKESTSAAAVISEAAQTTGSTEEKSAGLIGIALPAADHGWVAGTIYYAEQKCKSMGLDKGSGYKIVTSANVNEQANQIDELIAQKCSAIVLLPLIS